MSNKTLISGFKISKPKYPHILEFGVASGKSIKILKKLVDDSRRNQQVFGFDSFEGLPEDWEGTIAKKGDFSTNGEINRVDGVFYFKGWFEDTVKLYLQDGKPISLLHIDCDLYSSTKTVLDGLNHLILPKTVIVFDEWYYNHLDVPENRQHEQRAFFEWVETFGREYKIFPEIESERRIIKIVK